MNLVSWQSVRTQCRGGGSGGGGGMGACMHAPTGFFLNIGHLQVIRTAAEQAPSSVAPPTHHSACSSAPC